MWTTCFDAATPRRHGGNTTLRWFHRTTTPVHLEVSTQVLCWGVPHPIVLHCRGRRSQRSRLDIKSSNEWMKSFQFGHTSSQQVRCGLCALEKWGTTGASYCGFTSRRSSPSWQEARCFVNEIGSSTSNPSPNQKEYMASECK